MDDISDFLPLRVVETECKRSGELDKGDESDVMGFDGGGTRTLRYQWDDTVKYILETITRGPGVSQVACGEALADAVSDMRRELSLPECSPRTVRGLSFFFDELQLTATQQLQQRVCTTATTSSTEPRESTSKFDGQEIFCDAMKTDPIPWFRKFELTLQLHNVKEHKHHAYLYSRSGGSCQAWLDNLLSKYGVVANDLHTKITWDDLKAAWHKRFQVEPPEIKAMDKLMVFEQGTLPSTDWIAEYQRLTSVPDIQMGFKAIRHYFISRSCPTLSNALTHVEDTLTTTTKLFDKAAQIIVTNKEAKNLRSSASGPSRDQHRPRVAVVAAAAPLDQTSEAVSASEGDRFAAAREGLPIERQGQTGRLSTTESDATTLSTPSELVSSRVTSLHFEVHAKVDSPPLLLSFEDYAARLVPTLGTQAQGQGVCAVSSPSDNNNISSSSGSSRDSAREFNIEALDPLTSEDFAWLPLPTTGRLPGPQCAALSAHLHTYLSFYAPPTSPTDDEVTVGDILAYTTKVAREFRTQRYDNNNAPLMYVRIQVGQASCSALLDSGATRNFMSQSFMQRAGLDTQVRRTANPTAIKLADGKTQQLLDRYIEVVPVYFAPHACEPVTFDILDTDFNIILGMPWLASADHTVNFHRRTLSVRDAFGAEVALLETLRRAKYKANRDKCEFVRQELEYLGHFVTPEGISPLSDKIQAVQEWPEPRNVTDVRSFLGLTGYYQRFIKGYSKIAAHLKKLQCEDRPFNFGEEVRGSFFALKAALLSAEVLRIYDPLTPTRVTTDASGYGIGAVLEQHDGVDWHPVEYFSKKVPLVHSIDDARKKELLAFVHALKRWRHFLLGRSQFHWVTNNNPSVFYKTQDTVNSTIARWMAFIDLFDFFPDHIPGKSNRFADALSRRLDHCTAIFKSFTMSAARLAAATRDGSHSPALLVCAFLCVFPARGRDKYILPEINFNRLFGYAINGGAYDAKLRCILHYFNRICTNMPDGFVSFERKVLPSEDLDLRNMPPSVSDSSFWSTRKAVLCQFNVSEGGTIEDDGTGCLELDFANAYLGGGVLGAGCVQEEVRFVICPELIAGMLFLSAMAPNEAIEIVGAERFSRYTGYGTGFRFAGDFVDSVARDCFGRKRRMLVAIDALPCPGASQFRQSLLLRDLNKAFCGFLDHASIRGYCTVAGEPPSGGSNSPNLAGNAAQGSSPGKTGKGGEVDRGGGEEQLSRGASRVGSGTGAADVRFRDRRSCEELQNPSDMEIDCADDAEVGGSKNYIESSEFERETTESSHQGSAVGQMTVDGETSGSMSSVKNKRQGPCAPEGEGIRNRKAECEGMKTGNERDEGDGKEEREEGRCGTGSGSGSDGRATEMYSSDRGVAQQISVGIATGNWGCGAFGGDLEVKSMLQWIAASQAGRPFVSYFTYRDQRARRLREVTDWLQREMWTVGELWSMVTSYCGRRLNGEVNIGFFDWLLPMPETVATGSWGIIRAAPVLDAAEAERIPVTYDQAACRIEVMQGLHNTSQKVPNVVDDEQQGQGDEESDEDDSLYFLSVESQQSYGSIQRRYADYRSEQAEVWDLSAEERGHPCGGWSGSDASLRKLPRGNFEKTKKRAVESKGWEGSYYGTETKKPRRLVEKEQGRRRHESQRSRSQTQGGESTTPSPESLGDVILETTGIRMEAENLRYSNKQSQEHVSSPNHREDAQNVSQRMIASTPPCSHYVASAPSSTTPSMSGSLIVQLPQSDSVAFAGCIADSGPQSEYRSVGGFDGTAEPLSVADGDVPTTAATPQTLSSTRTTFTPSMSSSLPTYFTSVTHQKATSAVIRDGGFPSSPSACQQSGEEGFLVPFNGAMQRKISISAEDSRCEAENSTHFSMTDAKQVWEDATVPMLVPDIAAFQSLPQATPTKHQFHQASTPISPCASHDTSPVSKS
ncbi:hypothetical protein CBR_g41704 [Chara braunii]|uniref:poly(ADP-ribose) glycohydrolase n=1 Tax=Chara braunii TaxID=69332 RepID=A0A388LWQ1_CHABU|nr:hypothetical protein CBR_g41704 [Chara braunii]|eukprot:GBG86642.1 hypothetical protein CBR_g41704 [Chara braunii]